MVDSDIQNLIFKAFTKLKEKEVNENTIKELENMMDYTLDILKSYVINNEQDILIKEILQKIDKMVFYKINSERIVKQLEKIKENTNIKNIIAYMLNMTDIINVDDNYSRIEFDFYTNIKIKDSQKNLYIGTLKVYDNGDINAWLGYSDISILKIYTDKDTDNSYKNQLIGLISWLDGITERIKRELNKK